ncbi:MAG: pseudouridine synthase [Thermomicrobiales bacterium]
MEDTPNLERLQRILSAAGIASRRASEQLITERRVTVNGQIVDQLGAKADPLIDEIRVDGKLVRPQTPRYVMINKPSGFITTMQDERGRQTVMDLVPVRERIYPVGRLDRDTEGLLLLTNDGLVAHRIMHPSFELEKEYEVLTPVYPQPDKLARLRAGVRVDGKRVIPGEARILRETGKGVILRITLHEGMNHVIRKMMSALEIPVSSLRRTRIGPITMAGLPLGAWRDLRPGELGTLFEALKIDETSHPSSDSASRRTKDQPDD